MATYRLYSSAPFTVFRHAEGVEILLFPSNRTEWLQGDDANELESALDEAPSEVVADSLLSEYFSGEEV